MPETPDFETLARKIGESLTVADLDEARATFAESLRLVWNARGAADMAKVESELAQQMGATASGPYVKNLDRALRGLDR